ncbi:MAG TPA: bacillithiol biosynthesis deacetylase BshB1 [Gemmatimonadaceae bacterium]|nr:bacillithiol biosynthesis deacetylase BshB1 [Gemmatimonadaceae bacterium]
MTGVDVLAIGAHPDDIELICGGTLIRAQMLGRRTGILDLSAGELGSRGTREIRAAEAKKAAAVMEVSVRENLGLPDGGIVNTPETRAKIALVIRRLKPSVVITHSLHGRHPDHPVVAQLARDACFVSGLGKVEPGSPPHRPRKVLHALSFREDYQKPTFVVDITEAFEKKLEAVAAYASQFGDAVQAGEVYPNGEPLSDLMRHHAAHYGSLIRRRYGEPFHTTETMLVDDVSTLEVATF